MKKIDPISKIIAFAALVAVLQFFTIGMLCFSILFVTYPLEDMDAQTKLSAWLSDIPPTMIISLVVFFVANCSLLALLFALHRKLRHNAKGSLATD